VGGWRVLAPRVIGPGLPAHAEGVGSNRCGFGVGVLEQRLEIPHLGTGVSEQVLGEGVGQRLMQQFGSDLIVRARQSRNLVAHVVAAADEIAIRQRRAHHLDIIWRSGFLEAPWQDAVVLEIGHAAQQSVGHVAPVIAHDGFVHLNLIRSRDQVMVRFIARPIGVGVDARHAAVGVDLARLEDHVACGILDRDMQDDAARGIGAGQFMTGLAVDPQGEIQRAVAQSRIERFDRCRALQHGFGLGDGFREIIGEHAELGLVVVEDVQHQFVRADEFMDGKSIALLQPHGPVGNGDAIRPRHVALLAGLAIGLGETAALPFAVRHLFRELALRRGAQHVALLVNEGGFQVMAGAAEFGFLDVRAVSRGEAGMHHHRIGEQIVVGSIDQFAFADFILAGEAFQGAQFR